MNIIIQTVQAILAVDPTMHGKERSIIPRYGCPNHHWSTSELCCGKKVVTVVRFTRRKEKKIISSKNITCFHWSADLPLWSMPYYNLFWMLIVESSGFPMTALSWYPALLSSNSAVTLAEVVRCFPLMLRFIVRRPLSASLDVRPELLRLLEGFLLFLNSSPRYGW